MSLRWGAYAWLVLTIVRSPAQATPEELQPGKPITGQLQPGQPQTFGVTASGNELVCVHLNPEELRVNVNVLDPKKNQLASFKMPREAYGEFPLYFKAIDPGRYILQLESLNSAGGGFGLGLCGQRPLTAQDESLIAAQTSLFQAWQLREKPGRASLEQGVAEFEKALSVFKALHDTHGEATALTGLGLAYIALSQNDKAIESFNLAIPQWRRAGETLGVALSITSLGWSEFQLGINDAASGHLKEGLSLATEAGNRKQRAEALNLLASASAGIGDPLAAIDYLTEALNVQRQVGYREGVFAALSNLATMNSLAGDQRQALKLYEEGLHMSREGRDRLPEALTLVNMARCYGLLSESQRALSYYREAVALLRALGEKRTRGLALSGMGAIYQSVGDFDRALDLLQEALPLRKETGDVRGEAATLSNLGVLYSSLGKYVEALESLERALLLVKSGGDPRTHSNVIANIADVERSLGNKDRALENYREALRMRTAVNDRQGQAAAHLSLAKAYEGWADLAAAREDFNAALSTSRSVEDRRTQAASLYGLARIAAERGDLQDARSNIAAAITLVETMRLEFLGTELRRTYFASVRDLYDFQVDTLMRLHFRDPRQNLADVAFEASERGRARGLLDTLAEAHLNIQHGVDQYLLDQETYIRERLAAKADQQLHLLNGKHTDAQSSAIKEQLDQLINDLGDAETRIRQESPRYGALTQPQIATVRDVQTKLLDSDTILLEYALGEHRSYLWAVTKQSLSTFELPASKVVDSAAKRLYVAVSVNRGADAGRTGGDAFKEPTQAAAELSRILIDPVKELIKGKRILVVADGALQYIPFSLLREPGSSDLASFEPLIKAHEVINLSSASRLLAMREQPVSVQKTSKMVAVFADPVFDQNDARVRAQRSEQPSNPTARNADVSSSGVARVPTPLERSVIEVGLARSDSALPRLPFTRREADAILSTVPKGQGFEALDFQASLDTLNSPATAQYQVLHFATHGLLNTSRPALSGLVLSLVGFDGKPQRGFLELADIYNLDLAAELVVLSACQTGLGKEVRGEGLIGLTRGFLFAGAKGVVSSLWKVDDPATAVLMDEFYKGMFARHLRPAAALRAAEVTIWKRQRWTAPYFWSSFKYEGDWR